MDSLHGPCTLGLFLSLPTSNEGIELERGDAWVKVVKRMLCLDFVVLDSCTVLYFFLDFH
jgi:hypothetical protein